MTQENPCPGAKQQDRGFLGFTGDQGVTGGSITPAG